MLVTGRRSLNRLLASCVLAATAILIPGPAHAQASATAASLPVTRIEAEAYSAQRGTELRPAPPPSVGYVVEVSGADRLRYDRVHLARATFTLVCFVTSEPSGTVLGTIEVRLGGPRGEPQQTITVQSSLGGGVRQWAFGRPIPDGVHRLHLTVRQPAGRAPFALDYLVFSEVPPPPSMNC